MNKRVVIITVLVLFLAAAASAFLRKPDAPREVLNNTNSMIISSLAFENNESIPKKYACDGENVNPLLLIGGVPEEAKSLVLFMYDPDIPDSAKEKLGIEKFDHWTVFNIPPETDEIREDDTPPGIQGLNSAGKNEYTGPCPPQGEHRYFFELYALDSELSLGEEATQGIIEDAMVGHIIEKAELIGLYKK
jgi:Raf kinase inhibitor-like YbhB/YbcL family protein